MSETKPVDENRDLELSSQLKQTRLLNRQLEAVNAIAQIVATSTDLKGILEEAMRRLTQSVGFDCAALFMVDETGQSLVLHASFGFSQRYSQEMLRTRIGSQFPGMVVKTRKAELVENAADNRLVRAFVRNHEGVKGYACTPLFSVDSVIGVIEVASRSSRVFQDSDMNVLNAVAAQIVVGIQNFRLYERANTLAIEEERAWLAREVHDTIAQGLVAQNIELELAETALERSADIDAALSSIRNALGISRTTLDEARASIAYLRGSELDRPSLPDALANLARTVEERMNIEVSLHCQRRLKKFPINIEEALVRVATESLNNVWKHSHAKKVTISLTREQGELKLTIDDDGIGFDVSKDPPAGHYGLVGMRERLRRVGGTLGIHSVIGQGTRISAVLPLVKAD